MNEREAYQLDGFYKRFSDFGDIRWERWEETKYHTLYKTHIIFIDEIRPDTIIDLGCGIGHLCMLMEEVLDFDYNYIGYDFSSVAIEVARRRLKDNRKFDFKVKDLRQFDFVLSTDKKILYVMCEFLEHVESDLGILSKISKDSFILLSCPSIEYHIGHVRFFKTIDEVYSRYENMIDIKEYKKISLKKDLWSFVIWGIRK